VHGGAGINVLARQAGARLVVVDAGVAADLPAAPGLVAGKIARGTADISVGPAMTRAQAERSLELGAEVADAELQAGLDLLACGEMGIANTTPATAIVATFTGRPVAEVTGPGTGLDAARLAHKVAVIQRALEVNRPAPDDALDVLAKVGGFELGAIAGAMLAGAAQGVPVLVDGFIATAGAMLAAALQPELRPYLIAAHRSAEPGHDVALAWLELKPLLDLRLRLGEGSGAALAMPLVEAAARILNEMATFDQAGVSDRG
jgi:nicotinate-nucleotide--dimethylbenzimidazole phosphoribosyltransferase